MKQLDSKIFELVSVWNNIMSNLNSIYYENQEGKEKRMKGEKVHILTSKRLSIISVIDELFGEKI